VLSPKTSFSTILAADSSGKIGEAWMKFPKGLFAHSAIAAGRFAVFCLLSLNVYAQTASDIWNDVQHGYAENGDVKIHYATLGEGPLVIMIHGFPDFWYTWRHQMVGLQDQFKVVAIDQRGYNLSSQPDGEENYAMPALVSDIAAVIGHFGEADAIVVGHDWGGAVAWNVAFSRPDLVDKLIILNLPHPNGIALATANNPVARANTGYAQKFREGSPDDPDIFFGGPMTPQSLAGWVREPAARVRYVDAFERSDFRAMLAYYKQNYPPARSPDSAPDPTSQPAVPKLDKEVLIFHGLEDTALHSDGLNNTWDWIERDVTIVSAPGAGHFVQQDAAELVTSTMRWWLLARP
jgi:pimeloyl-ACP methyl ester carboxylesterase